MPCPKTGKKGFRGFRYAAVNLSNAIEFRLFCGTLRYSSFIAALQLIDRICSVAGCVQHPELVQYLKERRIYINEPVQTDAEV